MCFSRGKISISHWYLSLPSKSQDNTIWLNEAAGQNTIPNERGCERDFIAEYKWRTEAMNNIVVYCDKGKNSFYLWTV